jgi:hypothetical protein
MTSPISDVGEPQKKIVRKSQIGKKEKTENSKLRTENREPKTENRELKTENRELSTEY